MKDLSRSEREHLIDEWIFNQRDREILKRRWLDGICHDKLAEEFGLTDRQIKRIVSRHMKTIQSHR